MKLFGKRYTQLLNILYVTLFFKKKMKKKLCLSLQISARALEWENENFDPFLYLNCYGVFFFGFKMKKNIPKGMLKLITPLN